MAGKRVFPSMAMLAAAIRADMPAAAEASSSSAHRGMAWAENSQAVAAAVSRAFALTPPPRLDWFSRLSSLCSSAPTTRPSSANNPRRGDEKSAAQKIRPIHGLGMKKTVPNP